MSGILRPFPGLDFKHSLIIHFNIQLDQTTGPQNPSLTYLDVNSDAIRQQINNMCKFRIGLSWSLISLDRIPGTGGQGSQNTQGIINQYMPTDNMFITRYVLT